MLNIDKHRAVLFNMLRDIYSDNELAAQLVFKGGTCLMLFYGLDRFSTDLDFDLRENSTELDQSRLADIISKNLNLTTNENHDKRFTCYWSGSYKSGLQHIKIEISKRHWPQSIANQDFLGLTIPTLTPDKMFAHKLVAITDRKIMQNRDLYDAYFMFTKGFEIDEQIITMRTSLTLHDYLAKLTSLLADDQIARNILSGLGEVLSEERKTWAKTNLIRELTAQIKMYLDSHLP